MSAKEVLMAKVAELELDKRLFDISGENKENFHESVVAFAVVYALKRVTEKFELSLEVAEAFMEAHQEVLAAAKAYLTEETANLTT